MMGFSCKELIPVEWLSKTISHGFMICQEWLSKYMEGEADKSALFRLHIIYYELGGLGKKLVYRHVSPNSPRAGNKKEMEIDIGDAIVNLICLANILHIDTFKIIPEALSRLENKEWRKYW